MKFFKMPLHFTFHARHPHKQEKRDKAWLMRIVEWHQQLIRSLSILNISEISMHTVYNRANVIYIREMDDICKAHFRGVSCDSGGLVGGQLLFEHNCIDIALVLFYSSSHSWVILVCWFVCYFSHFFSGNPVVCWHMQPLQTPTLHHGVIITAPC